MFRQSRAAILLIGLVSLLEVCAWWWPNRPQAADVPMPDARFNAISFAPFRWGQSPLTDTFPTAAEAEADVALVAPGTRALRTYAAIEGAYDLAAMAEAHGLKLWLGIWLGSGREGNERELARGIEIANRYPGTVERVIVGNEVLLRRDLPVGELIAAIERVRAAVKQPVTYADVWEFWRQFPEVAAYVDIVTIHILPYWEDQPTGIDAAIAHVRDVYDQMAALFAGRKIAIGETGWPSAGRWRQDAAPSRVNQAVFLRRFIALAKEKGFDYNFIEAFDQVWKYQSEGTVGANWGLWTADRAPKFPVAGGVVEDPAWAWHAGAGIALGVALFACGVAARPRLGGALVRLAAIAMACGAGLAFAGSGTMPFLYDRHLMIAAWVNLGGQALLATLLMLRAAHLLAGDPVPPGRTGADATRTVRAILTLRWRGLGPWRPWWRSWLFDDLTFVFVWTAAVMQMLLFCDARYRDFPLPVFIVPLVAISVRVWLGDLPRGGGGREELLAGGTLAIAAIGSAVLEGPLNAQSLIWNAAALLLALPTLARVPFARVALARV